MWIQPGTEGLRAHMPMRQVSRQSGNEHAHFVVFEIGPATTNIVATAEKGEKSGPL